MDRIFSVRSAAVLASATALACVSSAARAGGFYLQEQSAKAVGRAFSGEVADRGAESLWWNPAAIGGLDRGSAYLGASFIRPTGDVRDTGTLIVRPGQTPAPVGGNAVSENPINNGLLPSGAIAYPITDRLAVGLAVTSPFSFTTDYETESWARYTADKTELRTIDIQPTIAFAATDWLRLGIGLNVEHSEATLSNALPNPSPALADGQQLLEGSGWDFGWSAGAQADLGGITAGISYKSAIEHELDGNIAITGLVGPLAASNLDTQASAVFSTPWQLIAGIRAPVTDRLTLNVQASRIGWSEFDAIRLGAPINAAIPENYRDTSNIAVGADYVVNPALTVRAGVQYDETPTRDGERDARVPDSNRWNYAVGASYNVTDSFAIDGAFMYTDIGGATIDRVTAAFPGTPAQTPILVSGELEDGKALVFSLGARARF